MVLDGYWIENGFSSMRFWTKIGGILSGFVAEISGSSGRLLDWTGGSSIWLLN